MIVPRINGQAITKNGNLLTWDKPTFANATWQEIKEICQSGLASTFWSLGDTKTITDNDGWSRQMRIVDMNKGRYQFADGTYNHIVVEITTLTYYGTEYSSTQTTYPNSTLASTLVSGGDYYDALPSDLINVLKPCNIKVASTNDGSEFAVENYECKIFAPALAELYTQTDSYMNAETTSALTGAELGQFGYYNIYDTIAMRTKSRLSIGAMNEYWTRTPKLNGYQYIITTSGTYTGVFTTGSRWVAIYFAI